MSGPPLLAVVPVRDGALPAGADEAVAEAEGVVLLIGAGVADAAASLTAPARRILAAEVGAYAAGAWAAALAAVVADLGPGAVILPGSPDGRDLAPRLASELGWPCWSGAVSVAADRLVVARHQGRALVEVITEGPCVSTLLPGIRGVEPAAPGLEAAAGIEWLSLEPGGQRRDAEVIEVVPPTAETMDLAEAGRVFAGGAGLGSADAFRLLTEVAALAGASMGATRVVADAGWVPFARQIGTTGTTISPELYVALGISGAVQHLTGVRDPAHVIAVNTDPSCPMMAAADLAVVADAPAVLVELGRLLGLDGDGDGGAPSPEAGERAGV